MRQIPKHRVGRIQKRVRRAFVMAGGRNLLTIDLLEAAYPRAARYEHKHFVSVYRAATRFAQRISRPGRAVVIWGPNRELAAALAEDAADTPSDNDN